MGDEWITGPVNTPKGLYFSGFSEEDASPDMGDSAITETFGVGGFAMIAAPAVTRFVGTGGFDDALRMLTLLKRPDIPVAAGAQVPLVKPLETAPEVHGETGLDGADLPEPGFLPQSLPAIELMARVLQESTEKVTLVVTGPMINAALFLRTCPDLAR
ncbi:inosine-uridine preferring nucleoside hydrolase [Limosilactobacillus fermentum]|nr:inosine-uridine preferring nucleoside hydrolase [Limosilactobacillus fermentum]